MDGWMDGVRSGSGVGDGDANLPDPQADVQGLGNHSSSDPQDPLLEYFLLFIDDLSKHPIVWLAAQAGQNANKGEELRSSQRGLANVFSG